MKKINYKNRSERRSYMKEIEKAFKSRKFVRTNEAFNRIKSELVDFGWLFEVDFNNAVEQQGKWRITTSPALRLTNEVFNITLLPKDNGIEISRLEVYDNYQHNGYAGRFLISLLQFFLQHNIEQIFLIPLPAGISHSSKTLNTVQLEEFYFRRGFRKLQKNKYWQLDIKIFLDYAKDKDAEFELLSINHIPMIPIEHEPKLPNMKSQLFPIKTRLYDSSRTYDKHNIKLNR